MRNIIIASTSTLHGGEYLEYLMDELSEVFKGVKRVVFVPYARPSGISHDAYTEIVRKAFFKIEKKVIGLHAFENPVAAVENAEAIFIGGGNTFVLADQLHRNRLIKPLREVVNAGVPYLGTSAGSNVCGLTIKTTNDMPIVYPLSFNALGLVPFNINPHYLDPVEGSQHMGETRETRIKEFHFFNTQPVVGLREGSWLKVDGDKIVLKGTLNARIFEYDKKPYEVPSETDFSLLK